MKPGDMIDKFICVSVNHRKAPINVIESVYFKDFREGLHGFRSRCSLKEVALLQTCNRVEVYAYSDDPKESIEKIVSLIKEKLGVGIGQYIEFHVGREAVEHLFRVASGLDSMMIGEYEILGQVKEALANSSEARATGTFLETFFKKALTVGKRVRTETEISKGPISLPHAAVDLAKLMGFTSKKVLVVGAGRTGQLLVSSLKAHGAEDVVILNRTFERAEKLAGKYGFKSAPLTELKRYLSEAWVVFVATAAPYYIVRAEDLANRDKELFIFDLSNPRNVEEKVAEVPFIHLRNIDDLREIAEKNRLKRLRDISKVEGIIEEELSYFERQVKTLVAEEVLKPILVRVEEVRKKELEKAIRILGFDGDGFEILEAMSRSMVSKILGSVIEFAKEAAIEGDLETLSLIPKIFGVKTGEACGLGSN